MQTLSALLMIAAKEPEYPMKEQVLSYLLPFSLHRPFVSSKLAIGFENSDCSPNGRLSRQ